jgi:hypothetical protein
MNRMNTTKAHRARVIALFPSLRDQRVALRCIRSARSRLRERIDDAAIKFLQMPQHGLGWSVFVHRALLARGRGACFVALLRLGYAPAKFEAAPLQGPVKYPCGRPTSFIR